MDDDALRLQIMSAEYARRKSVRGDYVETKRRIMASSREELERWALNLGLQEPEPEFEPAPGYSRREEGILRDLERQANPSPKVKAFARHPKPAFTTFLCQCSKCKLLITLDARRNGVPGGLQLEDSSGITRSKNGLVHHPAWKCGGVVGVFGKMPKGYTTLY